LGLRATVETAMRSPPVTVSFSDNILAVADRMLTNNVGAVIVMRGGEHVGIITERDVVDKILRGRRDPSETLAQDIMSSPLVSIEASQSIRDALELAQESELRRLAVTRNGRLVGIVTERRLLDQLV